jgi:DNA-binding NarL/FixJ family response regulator
MRRGIKTLLESHAGWEICGEAHTGRDAVAKAETLKPDIVILDISMPDLNGVDAAKRIRKISPETELLILSIHYSDQLIREILKAGVRGYLVKSDSDRDLVIAVETLANHKPFFHITSNRSNIKRLSWRKNSVRSFEHSGRCFDLPRTRDYTTDSGREK